MRNLGLLLPSYLTPPPPPATRPPYLLMWTAMPRMLMWQEVPLNVSDCAVLLIQAGLVGEPLEF